MAEDGKLNFSSYDDVEKLENYPSQEAIEAYRSERLAIYLGYFDFLAPMAGGGPDFRALQVGSGSSALLYAGEKRGQLKAGTGIELSRSRFDFAEKWKSDAGFKRVKNIHGNFADVEPESEAYDIFFVINDTLTYLGPEDPSYPGLLMKNASRSLRGGGLLVIEVPNGESETMQRLKREKTRAFWVELSEANAFRYSLYRQTFYPEENYAKSESIYITRDYREKRKCEYSTVFDRAALASLVEREGFTDLRWFADFKGGAYRPEDSRSIVLVARKP